MANILDGKQLSLELLTQLHHEVEKMALRGQTPPGLAVILVGNDPASEIYVRNKRLACEKVGFASWSYDLPANTTTEKLLALIEGLNHRPEVNGILVQLPLPEHINSAAVLEKIHPYKDVDGFHPYNIGRLLQKHPLLRPCTPYGIISLLHHYEIPIKSRHAVVVGASNIVGRPMVLELLLANATVTCCHRATEDLEIHVKQADILISAIGQPNIIQSEWLKPLSVVVDVGITRSLDGKVRGDIDFETAKEIAAWITPVPGGVGPMTVTTLLRNTLYARKHLNKPLSSSIFSP